MEFSPLSRILRVLFSTTLVKQTWMVLICSHLLDFDFDKWFQSSDIELIWTELKSVIYAEAMHLFILKIKIKSSRSPKWFTPTIRHLLNCHRTLCRKVAKHHSDHTKSKIESLEADLKFKISCANSDYEAHLIDTFHHWPQQHSNYY